MGISLLLKEGYIGKLKLRNRVIMSPMGMMFTEDFINKELSPNIIRFYEERAKGGVGLILVSPAYTEPSGRAFKYGLGIYEDWFIPALNKLVEAVHQHGAKIGLHLFHAGSYAHSSFTGAQPVSASAAFTNWLTKETPRELTISEIEGVVKGFAKAVRRAKEAGFDLVEYNAYSGYLIREFLCPLTNKRGDEYGGSLQNRLRFFREVIEATKKEVGEDYPLIAKISGDEFLPGGNGLNEACYIAKALEEWGISALHVSPAGHETTIPLTTGFVPKGAFVYLAQRIKQEVKIPVITAHISDVFLAEKVLEEGKADFIAFARSLLADPELVLKITQGMAEDIRPCIRCGQGCYDRVFIPQPVTCFMNPAVGKEKEYEIKSAPEKKRVMIIGGGPGGMETARVLALRGHQVSLYERRDRLGGQLIPSSTPPGKEEFQRAIQYYSGQLSKLGVKIFLNTEVTPQLVERESPEVVIIATGAIPIIPSIPGIERDNVVTAFDVLEGKAVIGMKVVVIGGGGVGCETALFLAKKGALEAETTLFLMLWGALDKEAALSLYRKGREVTILEMLPAIGRDMGISRRGFTRRLLTMLGVNVITEAEVKSVTEEGVEFVKGGQRQVIPADTIVIAVGTASQNQLYQSLQGKVPQLFIIGDAKQPRKAFDAIHEAAAIARQI